MNSPTRFKIPQFLSSPEHRRIQDERAAEWERDQKRFAREQQLVARRGRLIGAGQLGLKRRTFQQLVSGSIERTPALEAVQSWMRDDNAPYLLLTGGVGTGKTVAAAYFLVNHTHPVSWAKPWPLLRMFDAHYGPLVEERARLLECAALVVDDVGIETEVDKMRSVMLDIFEHRKPARTIITTNLEAEDFMDRYGTPRTTSRLSEGLVRVEGCGARDLRPLPEHQGG